MLNGVESSGPASGRPVTGAKWALALLLAINLFNYIDRQILNATLPKIKRDTSIFAPDATFVNFKLGALTTAFMVAYMLLSPIFGRIGDTSARWKVVGFAVIVWSLATGGTGAAVGYLLLFLARCIVGVGEAAYGPVAPAMLSDLYPVDHRGRILSWFYMAIPVGSALGFVIGSQVAGTSLGWRGAFHVAVLPGIALGLLCFFMKEPPRKQPLTDRADEHPTDAGSKPKNENYFEVLKELRGNRSFVLCCAGMTASTFVLGALPVVMPLYLIERESKFTLGGPQVEKLQTGTQFLRSDGSPAVPEDVIEKLKSKTSPDVVTVGQLEKKLKEALTATEYENHQEDIFAACSDPDSLTNTTIGTYLGGIVVIGGLVATLLGGLVGDYLRNRGMKGAYFQVSGWGMIAAFPFFVGMLFTSISLTWLLLFGAVFFLFFNTGPANAITANVVRSDIRATAFAINIFIIHALGDAISPPILGFIADVSSFQLALILVSLLIPLSGVLWIWGARYLDEDTRKATD
jgi:MFS family permease